MKVDEENQEQIEEVALTSLNYIISPNTKLNPD